MTDSTSFVSVFEADNASNGSSVIESSFASPDEFIAKRNFMFHKSGLGLSGVMCDVYALIYSYSIDNAGCYYGGIRYIAERFCISERQAKRIISDLKSQNLIEECGNYHKGDKSSKCYRTNPKVVEMARRNYVLALSNKPLEATKGLKNPNTCTSVMDVTPNTCTGVMVVTPRGDMVVTPRGDMDVTPLKVSNRNITKDIHSVDFSDGSSFNPSKYADAKDTLYQLRELSVNKNGFAYAPKPLQQLLEDGYTSEEIIAAFKKLMSDLERQGRDKAYYPNLTHWLKGDSGPSARDAIAKMRSDKAKHEAKLEEQREARARSNEPDPDLLLIEAAQSGDAEAQEILDELEDAKKRFFEVAKRTAFDRSVIPSQDPDYVIAQELFESQMRRRDAYVSQKVVERGRS